MNFHILESNGTTAVCFHIDIPSGVNTAGHAWCDCVRDSDRFKNESCLIGCDHEQDIEDGKIIEVREAFKFSKNNLTDIEKRAELQARHAEIQTKTLDTVLTLLRVFNYSSD